jgi:hypothetical protein
LRDGFATNTHQSGSDHSGDEASNLEVVHGTKEQAKRMWYHVANDPDLDTVR